MTAQQLQAWVGVLGALLTAIAALVRYFNYRTTRDRLTAVGEAFSTTVQGLSSDNPTTCMAAAVLLRRFLNPRTEQGGIGGGPLANRWQRKNRGPYGNEAIEVTVGILRQVEPGPFQKVLADGLRYVRDLHAVDLQYCHLENAYLGVKEGDDWVTDLSGADLFRANLSGASLSGIVAKNSVFYQATLVGTVFKRVDLTKADLRDADLSKADFRDAILTDALFNNAKLTGARFDGALIGRCNFDAARDVPPEVERYLGQDYTGRVESFAGGDTR